MADADSLDYLEPDFDINLLTVPRLRSILVTYNVAYPSSAKKAQLMDLFNEHVAPQADKILAQRVRSKRSSMGIVNVNQDGVAESIEPADLPLPQRARRSRSPRKASTRFTSDSVDQDGPPPVARVASPTKRSSRRFVSDSIDENTPRPASPNKHSLRASRSLSRQHAQASDTDTGDDFAGGRLSSRRAALAPQTNFRRQPLSGDERFFGGIPEVASQDSTDDNPFSNDNPFQSGGSSPPLASRTPASTRRRTTGEPAHSKPVPSSRRRTNDPTAAVTKDGETTKTSLTLAGSAKSVRKLQPVLPVPDGLEPGEEFTPEEQLELAQEEAKSRNHGLIKRPSQTPTRRTGWLTPLWVLTVTLFGAYAAWYRQEKVAVGYCGLGRPATSVIPQNLELPDWVVSLVEPPCEPCPLHAYCYEDFSVRCENDFLLQPHPLSLGGFIPLPPTCEPDGEKTRRVKAVADKTVEELRDRTAQFECGELKDEQGRPAEGPAIEEEALKEKISGKRSKKMSQHEFDDLWAGAIGEVESRDEVEVKEA